jgi:hypothetical protein
MREATRTSIASRPFPVDPLNAAPGLDKSLAVVKLAKILFGVQDAAVLVGLGDQHIADLLDLELDAAKLRLDVRDVTPEDDQETAAVRPWICGQICWSSQLPQWAGKEMFISPGLL